MKRAATIVLSSLFALLLCSCGSSGTPSSASNSQTTADASTSQEQECDPTVDTINLALDDGSIRFIRAEKASAGLTGSDSSNAMVFVFEFTNEQSYPASVQSVFKLQFFQDGSEITDNLSYYSTGGDQFELVSAFFDEASSGGTVTFGELVSAKSNSPIAVKVSPSGVTSNDGYQTMEVAIDDILSDASSDSSSHSSSSASSSSSSKSSSSPSKNSDDTYTDGAGNSWTSDDKGGVSSSFSDGTKGYTDSDGYSYYSNPDGSTEVTDGYGNVVKDLDGDGKVDRYSTDGGKTWLTYK